MGTLCVSVVYRKAAESAKDNLTKNSLTYIQGTHYAGKVLRAKGDCKGPRWVVTHPGHFECSSSSGEHILDFFEPKLEWSLQKLPKKSIDILKDYSFGGENILDFFEPKLKGAIQKLSQKSGEKILDIFELKLKDAIQKLPFQKILTLKNVRMVVNEADGYQPHIIAPENGYRRLIEDGLSLLRDPSFHAVESVHQILKQIVTMSINQPECNDLARFGNLKAEIINHAAETLVLDLVPIAG
eukprot:gene16680-22939_t